jgi:hypothetical protein
MGYKCMMLNSNKTPVINLGKGEADSSILSGSTRKPFRTKRLTSSRLFACAEPRHETAGTERDLALPGVQKPCSLFLGCSFGGAR